MILKPGSELVSQPHSLSNSKYLWEKDCRCHGGGCGRMWAFDARRFLWSCLRRARLPRPLSHSSTTRKSIMSGGTIATALYACSISAPAPLGAVPEDGKTKAHHKKNGKGFVNPWDSSREMGPRQFIWAMLM
jgi:hypothetical protein